MASKSNDGGQILYCFADGPMQKVQNWSCSVLGYSTDLAGELISRGETAETCRVLEGPRSEAIGSLSADSSTTC